MSARSVLWKNPEGDATKVGYGIWEAFNKCLEEGHVEARDRSSYLDLLLTEGLDLLDAAQDAWPLLDKVTDIFVKRCKTLKPRLTEDQRRRIANWSRATGLNQAHIIGSCLRIGYNKLC